MVEKPEQYFDRLFKIGVAMISTCRTKYTPSFINTIIKNNGNEISIKPL